MYPVTVDPAAVPGPISRARGHVSLSGPPTMHVDGLLVTPPGPVTSAVTYVSRSEPFGTSSWKYESPTSSVVVVKLPSVDPPSPSTPSSHVAAVLIVIS